MEKLMQSKKSIMISSMNRDNTPAISYAPFIMEDNEIYIYISMVADHYNNLLENKNCSVMIIEDESEAKTVFARGRVSFNCEAQKLDEVEDKIFAKFDEVHSAQMMMVLKTMDFDMFKLSIKNGRLVKGFGQAFDVEICDGKMEITQVTEVIKNHK